jgi:hypothetical protein
MSAFSRGRFAIVGKNARETAPVAMLLALD